LEVVPDQAAGGCCAPAQGGSDRAQSEDGREREAPPLAAFFPAEAGNGAPGTAAPARSGSGGGGGGGQPQGQASDFPALGDANGARAEICLPSHINSMHAPTCAVMRDPGKASVVSCAARQQSCQRASKQAARKKSTQA
jgi:hypothetical protein